jgi:hypothetical protein
MKHFQLKLSFQSFLHSEKDKLASVSYSYETYAQHLLAKVNIAKNTVQKKYEKKNKPNSLPLL